MKRFIKPLLLCLAFSTSLNTTAQADVTANFAIQSDYVWRGISQNAEDPAIQGGLDYTHKSGVYVGIWGSNVDFGGSESTEFDIYAGWSTELENGVGINLGILEYTYHGQDGASDSNFTEYYSGVTYKGLSATYSIGDEFDDLIELSYSRDFKSGFSAKATYGDYDAYSYYSLGISAEFQEIGFDVSYWNTDINSDNLAEARVVLTVSKSF